MEGTSQVNMQLVGTNWKTEGLGLIHSGKISSPSLSGAE